MSMQETLPPAEGRTAATIFEYQRAQTWADAVELLGTTRTQVNQTVGVVANYGGSLDTILDDA